MKADGALSSRRYLWLLALVAASFSALGIGRFALACYRARQQRDAAGAITDLGGRVSYQLDAGGPCGGGAAGHTASGPAWLRRLLGDDFFDDVLYAEVNTDEELANVRYFPRLRSLCLCAPGRMLWSSVTDSGLKNIRYLTELRELDLSSTRVSDSALDNIVRPDRLESLYLTGTRVTDAELVRIQSFPNLRRVCFDGTAITDARLAELAIPAELCELGLAHTLITDMGLDSLRRFPHLRRLSLYGTGITDAGVAKLLRCPEVEFLQLGRTGVTDAAIRDLRRLACLKVLDVGETKITPEGVKRLQAALPRCQVLSGPPDVPTHLDLPDQGPPEPDEVCPPEENRGTQY